MNYRLSTLWERQEYASDKTEVIDIVGIDMISRIMLIYEAYNSVSGAQTGHPALCIPKIEIVDGSDVIFSLSGKEAQAVDWYNNRVEPQNLCDYLPSRYSEMIYNINFGRFLYDPKFAFDPTKFRNPQLKVTIDIDGGGSTVTKGYLTALMHLFDEKSASPIGFLMHKEVKDYAFGAGTHEYTDLPNDYPIRKLLLRAQKYGDTGVRDCFDTIKLSEDNDKRIPLNHSILNILKSITSLQKPYQEWVLHEGSAAGAYVYITPTEKVNIQGTQWRSTASQAFIAYMLADGGRATFDQYSETSNTQALVTGWCPHGVLEIPFGDQMDESDWYDVARIKNLKLDVKSGSGMSSSESCQVLLQQARRY